MTDAVDALRRHWPEYLIEAVGLGVFMIMAGVCLMLVEHPDRRSLMRSRAPICAAP